MREDLVERLTAYLRRARQAGEKLETLSEDYEYPENHFTMSLRRLSPSAVIQLAAIIDAPESISELGKAVTELNEAIEAEPRLRAGHGVHAWVTYSENEAQWTVTLVDSLLQADGLHRRTRELHRVHGDDLQSTIGDALAALPGLERPGYT